MTLIEKIIKLKSLGVSIKIAISTPITEAYDVLTLPQDASNESIGLLVDEKLKFFEVRPWLNSVKNLSQVSNGLCSFCVNYRFFLTSDPSRGEYPKFFKRESCEKGIYIHSHK